MRPMQRLAAILCLEFLAGVALGDGGMFFHQVSSQDVLQPTQKVYIQWDGSQEKLLVQTKYQGPAEEMVWIVPVPSKPTVRLGDGAVFESLSKETTLLDISLTSFTGLQMTLRGGGSSGTTSPAEWQEQIGEYDVALLRPVGEEDVVQWLPANGFAIPDTVVPILNDYVRKQWWMVVAKIHPDALTNITRDRLAQGLLHPLELTFASSACVYPMRLTSMAGGPVEELIYIEGPAHYEPATLAGGTWTINIFGGPIRQVPDSTGLSDLEIAVRTREGQTQTTTKRYLTKLRRIFQTSEMTDDLVFRKLDYATWLAGLDADQIAQAATQYGRNRDPNGIPFLLAVLSPAALAQVNPSPEDYVLGWPLSVRSFTPAVLDKYAVPCRHLRSCMWAIGEIGIGHTLPEVAEETLLRCARHDNQIVRMEAYIALVKLGSTKIGSICADRVAEVLTPDFTPGEPFGYLGMVLTAEMDTVIGWIAQFGTGAEKDALVAALTRTIPHLPTTSEFYLQTWPEWVMEKAALLGDPRLIEPLNELLAAIPSDHTWTRTVVQAAEIACGSSTATEPFISALLVAEEAQVLQAGTPTDGSGYGSLYGYYHPLTVTQPYRTSLRVQILQKRQDNSNASGLSALPPQIANGVVRQVIDRNELTDWYALYLLSLIWQPTTEDKDRLMKVLNRCETSARVVALDVLYLWADTSSLLDLYGKAGFADLKSEAAWALAALRCVEAVDAIQEQIWGCWNGEILTVGATLVDPQALTSRFGAASSAADAGRKAEALWNYFRPQGTPLDQKRLELLQRICGDGVIHPGLRYLLLGVDYGSTGWGQPLLEKAVRDIFAVDLSPRVVDQVSFTLAVAGDGEFLVGLCADATADEFRRGLLNGVLSGANSNLLPVVQALLGQVWPQRYGVTDGQSLLFREPDHLSEVLDYYSRSVTGTEDFLESLVRDTSLPAGYRAFLLVNWPKAPTRVSKDFAASLLDGDMPDFIREALEKRLVDWQ
jgi:hypothetical protein